MAYIFLNLIKKFLKNGTSHTDANSVSNLKNKSDNKSQVSTKKKNYQAVVKPNFHKKYLLNAKNSRPTKKKLFMEDKGGKGKFFARQDSHESVEDKRIVDQMAL